MLSYTKFLFIFIFFLSNSFSKKTYKKINKNLILKNLINLKKEESLSSNYNFEKNDDFLDLIIFILSFIEENGHILKYIDIATESISLPGAEGENIFNINILNDINEEYSYFKENFNFLVKKNTEKIKNSIFNIIPIHNYEKESFEKININDEVSNLENKLNEIRKKAELIKNEKNLKKETFNIFLKNLVEKLKNINLEKFLPEERQLINLYKNKILNIKNNNVKIKDNIYLKVGENFPFDTKINSENYLEKNKHDNDDSAFEKNFKIIPEIKDSIIKNDKVSIKFDIETFNSIEMIFLNNSKTKDLAILPLEKYVKKILKCIFSEKQNYKNYKLLECLIKCAFLNYFLKDKKVLNSLKNFFIKTNNNKNKNILDIEFNKLIKIINDSEKIYNKLCNELKIENNELILFKNSLLKLQKENSNKNFDILKNSFIFGGAFTAAAILIKLASPSIFNEQKEKIRNLISNSFHNKFQYWKLNNPSVLKRSIDILTFNPIKYALNTTELIFETATDLRPNNNNSDKSKNDSNFNKNFKIAFNFIKNFSFNKFLLNENKPIITNIIFQQLPKLSLGGLNPLYDAGENDVYLKILKDLLSNYEKENFSQHKDYFNEAIKNIFSKIPYVKNITEKKSNILSSKKTINKKISPFSGSILSILTNKWEERTKTKFFLIYKTKELKEKNFNLIPLLRAFNSINLLADKLINENNKFKQQIKKYGQFGFDTALNIIDYKHKTNLFKSKNDLARINELKKLGINGNIQSIIYELRYSGISYNNFVDQIINLHANENKIAYEKNNLEINKILALIYEDKDYDGKIPSDYIFKLSAELKINPSEIKSAINEYLLIINKYNVLLKSIIDENSENEDFNSKKMTILSLFNNLIFKNNSIEIENKILNHANELENQKIFKLFNEFILEKRNLLEKFKLNEYDKSEVFIRAASNLI